MPEKYLGDLSQFKLFDLLKPLLTDRVTGRILIRGRESGEIYLDAGNIAHAKTDHFGGECAFFSLMGLRSGKVVFDPDFIPKEKTISIETEQLLLNWSSRKQEFEKIFESIPSGSCVFRLSMQTDGRDKNITADQWNLLALTNGGKTISEIGEILKWDDYKLLKTTYQLIQLGLIEAIEESKPLQKRPVGENFFLLLERELKKAIGPVAPFIIEDKLEEFGQTKSSFPNEQAISLIESLSLEIPNPFKRNEFIQVMTKALD